MESILSEYQKKAKRTYEHYILEYFHEYGDERTTKTAIKFLSKKHEQYRKECTSIALECIRKTHEDMVLTSQIMEQNASIITLLQEKIIAVSQI